MGKKTSLENKLLAAYLSGFQAGVDAMKKRAGECDIKFNQEDLKRNMLPEPLHLKKKEGYT